MQLPKSLRYFNLGILLLLIGCGKSRLDYSIKRVQIVQTNDGSQKEDNPYLTLILHFKNPELLLKPIPVKKRKEFKGLIQIILNSDHPDFKVRVPLYLIDVKKFNLSEFKREGGTKIANKLPITNFEPLSPNFNIKVTEERSNTIKEIWNYISPVILSPTDYSASALALLKGVAKGLDKMINDGDVYQSDFTTNFSIPDFSQDEQVVRAEGFVIFPSSNSTFTDVPLGSQSTWYILNSTGSSPILSANGETEYLIHPYIIVQYSLSSYLKNEKFLKDIDVDCHTISGESVENAKNATKLAFDRKEISATQETAQNHFLLASFY